MNRIQQGVSATLSQTVYVDGVATNPTPDSATVTIIRADGTALVTDGVATDSGTGVFTYTLTPDDTALLDSLMVAWTFTIGGQAQTITERVEIVGGFLFSIADARAIKPLENTTTYPTAKIVAARTLAEEALEDACGVAFVPRYRREQLTGYGTSTLLLRPRVRTVRSASIDGTDLTVGELADLRLLPTGEVWHSGRWASGFASTVIAYEHGFDAPPAMASRCALLLAKRYLVNGPLDDRYTSISTDEGTFGLITPGVRGAIFDIPEVNAFVQQHNYNVAVA